MLPTRETFQERESTGVTGDKYKVVNLFTKKGTNVFPRRRLCEVESEGGNRTIIKAKSSGVVTKVLVTIGESITDGSGIVEVEACGHTALMGNICCDCGVLLREEDLPKSEAVSMLHSVPDLKISRGEAQKLGQEDIRNLLKQRKLVLLVDLDQTLIHTTNDNIPANLKDVYHFQLAAGGPWYHARLRPHTRNFLENISKYYELHISTFGVREYAHHIASFLDPNRKLFGQRILSRNECLNLMSKKANLDSLFPCGDNLVCIIDDRTDVWNFSHNVVQVAPYHFFRHTGDINAPAGLQKKERDDCEGIDFKNLKKEIIRPIVTSENEKENVNVSKTKINSSQSSPQTTNSAQPQVDEVKANRERGLPSDTKSNEDSGNYSGSDESWASSPEAQESSTEGQESSSGERVAEAKFCSEKKSNSEVQEATLESKGNSENSSEIQTTQATLESRSKTDSKADSESLCQEADLASGESNSSKPQQPGTEKSKLLSKEPGDSEADATAGKSETENSIEEDSKNDSENGENNKENLKKEAEETKSKQDQQSQSKDSEEGSAQQQGPPVIPQQQVFDVIDDDDYLLYLEDILKKVHKVFFKEYEAGLGQSSKKLAPEQSGEPKGATLDERPLPDLKKIVPAVKKSVLQGVNIVFSGVVPTQVGLKHSKAYLIGTSFGATVSEKVVLRGEAGPLTTHLVAANRHTEKVNAAKKAKSIKIVTPNWLWKCAERWERVEELLFPLNKDTEKSVQRVPPLHCSNPEMPWLRPKECIEAEASQRTRSPSGTFLGNINPLVYLSPDDMNNMEDEVEKILSDDNDSESDANPEGSEDHSSSDDNDMESGDDEDEEEEDDDDDDDEDEDGEPKRKKRRSNALEDEEDNEDELPSVMFRQGGQLPSDDSNSEDDDEDEGDLRRMGADLESLLN